MGMLLLLEKRIMGVRFKGQGVKVNHFIEVLTDMMIRETWIYFFQVLHIHMFHFLDKLKNRQTTVVKICIMKAKKSNKSGNIL